MPERLKSPLSFQFTGCKPNGKLIAGFGASQVLGDLLKPYGNKKVLLVSDKALLSLGVVDYALESVVKAGISYDVYSEIEPEPHIESFRNCQELIRNSDYMAVVGMGGGSAMDVAKVASVSSANADDILAYCTGKPIEREGLPLILAPTTSGTGSEVSPYIVTSHENKKLFFGNPYLYPLVSLLDPLLTVSMPPKVTASTGLDALSHAIEGYLGSQTAITETFTTKSVEYVMKYLKRACENGEDFEARYHMAFAAVYGMLSYSQGGGLYAHSLSYILTLARNLPHGAGCGLGLPYTMMFNLGGAERAMSNLTEYLGRIMPVARGRDHKGNARSLVEAIHKLVSDVGLPASLKELGVPREEIELYAEALRRDYYRTKNPRPLSAQEAVLLVRSMWDGELREIPVA